MSCISLVWTWRNFKEKLLLGVVWKMPRGFVYWCAVRVFAHATGGPYGDTVVTELTSMDALKRWDNNWQK